MLPPQTLTTICNNAAAITQYNDASGWHRETIAKPMASKLLDFDQHFRMVNVHDYRHIATIKDRELPRIRKRRKRHRSRLSWNSDNKPLAIMWRDPEDRPRAASVALRP